MDGISYRIRYYCEGSGAQVTAAAHHGWLGRRCGVAVQKVAQMVALGRVRVRVGGLGVLGQEPPCHRTEPDEQVN